MTDINTKRKNFHRLAQVRTEAALEKIRILGNCANRSSYSYTDEEVGRIFNALDEQLKIVKAKFRQPRKKFKL